MASKTLIQRSDKRFDREIATGASAMAPVSFTPRDLNNDAVAAKVHEFRIHLSAASATSEDLVVTVDSASGSAYDINILTEDMNAVQDLRISCLDLLLLDGDVLTFTWANSDSRTYGLEIIYQAFKS